MKIYRVLKNFRKTPSLSYLGTDILMIKSDDFPFQLENLYLIIFILPPDKYVQASVWNLAEHRQLPDIVD